MLADTVLNKELNGEFKEKVHIASELFSIAYELSYEEAIEYDSELLNKAQMLALSEGVAKACQFVDEITDDSLEVGVYTAISKFSASYELDELFKSLYEKQFKSKILELTEQQKMHEAKDLVRDVIKKANVKMAEADLAADCLHL